MATSSGGGPRPPRRTPAGSRTPTSRPRKVAGRGVDDRVEPDQPDQVEESGDVEDTTTAPVAAPSAAPVVDLVKEPVVPEREPAIDDDDAVADEDERDDDGDGEDRPVPMRSRRLVGVLVAAVVVLAGIGAAEVVYLLRGPDPVVSAQRPVVVTPLTAQSVVDQAAAAAEKIITATTEDYDAQVEEATATMTAPFAEDFRSTKAEIEDEFVAADTAVTAEVSAQGVVTASPEQVVALLFLTQTTTKAGDDLTVAQYRVTVTMSRTDDGWLVSDLQTQ